MVLFASTVGSSAALAMGAFLAFAFGSFDATSRAEPCSGSLRFVARLAPGETLKIAALVAGGLVE
jgi:hypothetical protein